MKEKYVAYLRVSTKEQGKSGLGLEAQRRDIMLFTQNRPSETKIIGEYIDIVSGSNSSREALSEAVRIAKSEGATLLVSKLDRLSRKVSFVASMLEDKDLKFKVASMPNADKFQLHIYAALAEQERDFISMRTKAALAEKKRAGAKLGGLRDATNRRNKEKSRIADENAARLFDLVLPLRSCGLSLAAIAQKLNSNGLTTPKGNKFYPQTIINIINRANKMAP